MKEYLKGVSLTILKKKHGNQGKKGLQSHNTCSSGICRICLEKNKIKDGAIYSFRCIKHEISMVKQPMISSSTFDEKRCFVIN